jgi:hypothetical protein
MKAVIKEKEPPENYPWIGTATDDSGERMIVAFSEPKTGVFIGGESTAWPLFFYCSTWIEKDFTPFTGSITLSND